MRLLTFQDKIVIDTIEQKEEDGNLGIFESDKKNWNNKEDELYDLYIKRMKDSLDIPEDRDVVPIWAWVVPKSQEIDDEYLLELYERMIPKANSLVAIEMEVPKEFIFVSNFDEWYNLKFECAFNKEFDIEDSDLDILFKKQKNAILQTSLPFITRDFITDYIDYNNYVDRDYSKTEDEVKMQINDLKNKNEFDSDDWV